LDEQCIHEEGTTVAATEVVQLIKAIICQADEDISSGCNILPPILVFKKSSDLSFDQNYIKNLVIIMIQNKYYKGERQTPASLAKGDTVKVLCLVLVISDNA
jgi:hypothetical protein